MFGQMQQHPLLISGLIEHASRHHGDVEVVSRRVEGDTHRETYREMAARTRQLANALAALGIEQGDRIATMAWTGYRHMELYYAVSGHGAILHTINPRLHADQLTYITHHAADRVLFFDATFLPILEPLAPRLQSIQHFVLMTDRAHMPATSALPNLLCYEDLLAAQPDTYRWPTFSEETASSLCYTSGTTGNPKGVLYSHRSLVLHSFAIAMQLNFSVADTVLPIVPMFHVNAWGTPYTACMVGAKLVLPGPALDGKSLHTLFEDERVTCTAGVPTIWQGLLNYLESTGLRCTTLKRISIGGSACSPKMLHDLQDTHGFEVIHAWGMTETSPLGTVSLLKPKHATLSKPERDALQTKQGFVPYGVDIKITDDHGNDLPWDGASAGELHVRGPWIISRYFREDHDALIDGWFPTGDVATIDPDGYMQITDRSKDLIKSGGEWIGSIELEGIAASHPSVAMAACIGIPHPKWQERPLLVVIKKPNANLTREDLLAHYKGKVATWWVPDDVAFVDTIPIGATGKIQKNKLRETFATTYTESTTPHEPTKPIPVATQS
ncbi:MAG: 3-(methylthio)propionyl-CoA ligase [Acidobacteriaceae bacterium]